MNSKEGRSPSQWSIRTLYTHRSSFLPWSSGGSRAGTAWKSSPAACAQERIGALGPPLLKTGQRPLDGNASWPRDRIRPLNDGRGLSSACTAIHRGRVARPFEWSKRLAAWRRRRGSGARGGQQGLLLHRRRTAASATATAQPKPCSSWHRPWRRTARRSPYAPQQLQRADLMAEPRLSWRRGRGWRCGRRCCTKRACAGA